jgi:hypothetical protein
VLAGLEHLPVGRTTLLVELRRPGQGNIRLPLDVITPAQGRLKLTVLSDETGEPTPAMVRLTSLIDGRARAPANAVQLAPMFDSNGVVSSERTAFLPGTRKGSFWCMPGPVDMTLPPGEWEIAVGRGFEHTPLFEKITIRPDATTTTTVRPRRWVQMSTRGWWSADDHVHGRLVSDDDARKLMAWAQAEDVHLTNLVQMGDIYRTYFQQRGFGPEFRVQSGDYILAPAQECPRTSQMGHVLTMNLTGVVRDTDHYFLYDTVLDRVHAQGGLTGYAHAATGMFEVHRDMTLNVPTRKIDFFEIHQFNNLGTDLYYEFLNLGCKVTASGGSDLPWGGTIGETRVYSYLGQQPFTADRWFEAFGRGRTFTTSGPMITFSVDDALPGDELVVTPGRKLRIRAHAWDDPTSTTPVRLEIVQHGQVIRSAVSGESPRNDVELDFTVEAGDGFWIAARAYTGIGTSAHTTPVYVIREGLRFWKFDSVDALIDKRLASLVQIEQLVTETRSQDRGMRLESDRNRKQLALQGPELLERVASARTLYSELRKTADDERSRRSQRLATSYISSDPAGWTLVMEQNFPVANEFSHWKLEGSADVSVTMFRTLLVETKRRHLAGAESSASTLWLDLPAIDDTRIEFDARADAGTTPSFFFNARASSATSPFEWQRPHARDEDYAADDRLELYALEILRSGENRVALKYFGGGRSTTLATAPSPFGDPEKLYHFDVRAVGTHLTLLVDGEVLFDVVDKEREGRPLSGGYMGFRSARLGAVAFDNVRVYRYTSVRGR